MSTTARRTINSNGSRSARLIPLFGAALSLLALLIPAPRTLAKRQAPQAAECEGGVGGRLFANGGNVEVEMLQADAGFTIELHLLSPGPDRFIATNRETGTTVSLGTFSAGTELVLGAYVRETGNTFRMGLGSSNPDGIPHAEVTCFSSRRANVGFEDQFGGGDRDYNDMLCTVRQASDNCGTSISPSSQSFDWRGGTGNVSITVAGGCSWSGSSDVGWIDITSGGSGSSSGTLRYSVASNSDGGSRSGTISIQGQTFTVFQDGIGGEPLITGVSRDGKRLYVYGINFDSGSVILLNGDQEKTKRDPDNPNNVLIGKKTGKHAQPGDTLQVRNGSGATSHGYTYNP